MSDCAAVLDASAVLAVLQRERGEEAVTPLVGRAAWSAVNLCEVASKLTDKGIPVPEVREMIQALDLTVHGFDHEAGLAAAELRRFVPQSLSLGDRACLALARRLRLPAVTAASGWRQLRIDGLVVQPIR